MFFRAGNDGEHGAHVGNQSSSTGLKIIVETGYMVLVDAALSGNMSPNTVLNLGVNLFSSCGLCQLLSVCANVAVPWMDILTFI